MVPPRLNRRRTGAPRRVSTSCASSSPSSAPSVKADRKSTRLNSSHLVISYAVFCLKKKKRESTLVIPIPNSRVPLNFPLETCSLGLATQLGVPHILTPDMKSRPRHSVEVLLYDRMC